MNKIITIVIIAVVIGGGVLFYKERKLNVKEFTIVGENFSFSPANISVKKGDTVKIIFKDDDGYHDLKIDGYNVVTERVQTGQESVISFVADKVGSFEYFCTVGDHQAQGMEGLFVVTE